MLVCLLLFSKVKSHFFVETCQSFVVIFCNGGNGCGQLVGIVSKGGKLVMHFLLYRVFKCCKPVYEFNLFFLKMSNLISFKFFKIKLLLLQRFFGVVKFELHFCFFSFKTVD